MCKIKTAGAGASGLTTAINLARAGFSVELFEPKGDVGCRFSGGHQGLENRTSPADVLNKLEELGVKPNEAWLLLGAGGVF
jgi:ribulose 1,5-bisphosphate synthetase/thiazole synthase